VVKYKQYLACSRYSQSYSVGGSSGAAFRHQYCRNLFSCGALLSIDICCPRPRSAANQLQAVIAID